MTYADGEDWLLGHRRVDMLPPLERELVGREEQLSQLHRLMLQSKADRRRGAARVAITGVAGVGKSALGTGFANSLEDEYRDGTLYVDLNRSMVDGVVNNAQILREFLEELGEGPDQLAPEPNLPARFNNATDEKRLIVFLDNVQDYTSVEDLVPKSPTCFVIFTSLRSPDATIRTLPLEPLSDEDAVKLFGEIAPSRKVDDDEANAQLVKVLEACAGLPIAILPLAARLERNPGYTLARIALDLSSLFGEGRDTIERCFSVSYNELTDLEQRLFRGLAILPGESFDVAMAACLSEKPLGRARQLLEKLRALQLIQGTQDEDYFSMHSLLRRFASELKDAKKKQQLRKALVFCCEQAEDADRVIRSLPPLNNPEWSANGRESSWRHRDPAEERDRALTWMEDQHKNLVAAVIRACDDGQADIAWRTCRALVEFFDIRGKWESWQLTHEAAAKVVPMHSEGDAYVGYGLGRYYGARQQWQDAINPYRTAIAVFRQHGDELQVGRSLNSLGDAYRYMREWTAAENCFEWSLKILKQFGNSRQLAIAKRSMSTIHRVRGQFRDAMSLCNEAIAILKKEEPPDQRWIAATQLSLADIYLDKRSHDDARGLLEECLEVFKNFGDSHWLALTRRSLADALREDGEYDAALEQLQLCRDSLRQAQDQHWEGQVLHSFGLVYLGLGDTELARENFEMALQHFGHPGPSNDPLWQGRTHLSLGRTASAAGNASKAKAEYHTAWPLLVEQGAKADLDWLKELLDAEPDEPEAPRPAADDPE
jgi:tetratricopeptide (TPR) repeat protein